MQVVMAWNIKVLIRTPYIPEALQHVVHRRIVQVFRLKVLGSGWMVQDGS